MRHVTAEDLERTRAVLADLARRQESLGELLDAAGVTDFIERSEWLAQHRTPDEALAVERAWSRLFRRHGITPAPRPHVDMSSLAVPHPRPEPIRFDSLASSKPKRPPRSPKVVVDDRALEIAKAVLDQHPERRTSWLEGRTRDRSSVA